jgi:hypothetical protein
MSRVLLEKLAGRQLVKKYPSFYGTRRFITAFTRARHPSLSTIGLFEEHFMTPKPKDEKRIITLELN